MSSTLQLVHAVCERGGLRAETAGRIFSLTLHALGEQLEPALVSKLKLELPPTVAGWLSGVKQGELRGMAVLLARVLEVEPKITPAHVRVVLQVIAEAAQPATLAALRFTLPDDLSELLVPRAA
jgi:uncharacterized protein (DUF2267 family)